MYTGAARDGSSSLRTKWFPACVMHESQRYLQLRKRPAPLCPESSHSHNSPPAGRNRDADHCYSEVTDAA